MFASTNTDFFFDRGAIIQTKNVPHKNIHILRVTTKRLSYCRFFSTGRTEVNMRPNKKR